MSFNGLEKVASYNTHNIDVEISGGEVFEVLGLPNKCEEESKAK